MKNKNILVIVAHPDDEVIGVGGIIAKAVNEWECKVKVILVNSEVWGDHIRTTNSRTYFESVSKILGFDYQDLKLTALHTTPTGVLVKTLEEQIFYFQPHIIITHNIGDLHQDHRAIAEATLIASRPKPDSQHKNYNTLEEVYSFETRSTTETSFGELPTFTPNTYIDVSKYWKLKTKALNIYKENIPEYPHPRSLQAIEALATLRGTEVGQEKTEALKLIRSVRR